MNTILRILFALGLFAALNGCKSDTPKESHKGGGNPEAQDPHSHEDHEGGEQVAALSAEQIKTIGITFGSIEYKNLTATIKANGALRVPNNNKANATSLYGGVVKTLKVQLGDAVHKGQVIATIENPLFVQLQEEYLTLGSRIILAEQEMQRQKELSEGNAGAVKNLQSATADLNALRARKASLQKQIQLMGINPAAITASNLQSALVVTSPVNGTVSNEFAKIGSYVDVSSPVVEIVDNSLIHLDLQVFERDLPYVQVGQTVIFTLTNNPNNTFTAKVFNIGSSFENESKTIAVHCTVTGNKKGLIDGMNITGKISIEDVKAAAVPNEAIVEADGKYYVFIQTDKVPGEEKEKNGHSHDHDHDHNHDHGEGAHDHDHANKPVPPAGDHLSFEKIEVIKGVSDMGYTAVTPVRELPAHTRIVVKGAFFINAKLSNTGGGHAH